MNALRHIVSLRPVLLAMSLLMGLGACATLPGKNSETTAVEGPQRSAESLRLQKYYTSVQSRLLTQGLLRTDGGGVDTPFSTRTLVEDFERIALFDEYAIKNGRFVAQQTPSFLRRWEKQIRIGLVFGDMVSQEVRDKDTKNVIAYGARLARLTGLDIRVTDKNPNFLVMFLYRDEQKTVAPLLQDKVPALSNVVVNEIVNSPRNIFCVAYAFSDLANSAAYSSAIILVKAEHPDLMRLSCIHEEMAQALGLANDSQTARPSIFNDDEEFALLTRHDELLLRMLYDPRLKLGMTPDTARALLPRVAEDTMQGSS